jgi:hypothetical protein
MNVIEKRESGKATIEIAKAHARAIKARGRLSDAGVEIRSIFQFRDTGLDATELIWRLNPSQAALLLEFLNCLLALAEAMGGGEVDLTTAADDSIRVLETETGITRCYHAMVELSVAMHTLESNPLLRAEERRIKESMGVLKRGFEHVMDNLHAKAVAQHIA